MEKKCFGHFPVWFPQTAVKLCSDMLMAADSGTPYWLYWLYSAFDAVDHSMMVNRFKDLLGLLVLFSSHSLFPYILPLLQVIRQ